MAKQRMTDAQLTVLHKLVEGCDVKTFEPAWVVKSSEYSFDKLTKDVNFHRAVRKPEADANDQRAYKFDVLRIKPDGTVSRL